MKKLIIAALFIVGLSAFAQEGKEMENKSDRPKMEKMSLEQRNQLMLKKMTLDLDLNVKQQEQMKPIIAERNNKLEAMKAERMSKKADEKRPTSDEHFAMKNKMLDEQIAMQNKMKSILSPEQFNTWKNMKEKHHEKFQERRHERRPDYKRE